MVERQPGSGETPDGVQGGAAGKGRDAADPLVGRMIADRFRVLEIVARGGMGKIYKAEQLPLGRIVALKVLLPADRRDDEEDAFRRRFEREASICAKLTHSNTVRIFDFGVAKLPDSRGGPGIDLYYIAMEFIDGVTLQQLLRTEAPLPPLRAIHIARQVCGSLGEAHKQGIVHRDLKPGNVLLTTQGDDRDFVKVVDFGLVKHVQDNEITQAGLIVGSPMYMSPEQVRGGDIDHRSDIYALGMMLYVSLTGKRPFDRDTPIQVLMARMTNKPPTFKDIAPAVKVPESLEWLVMTCLSTDRRDRFASMHEVVRALRVCEAEASGGAGTFKMSLEGGRVVLPPDFSDPSIARAGSLPPPSDRSVSVSVAAAGPGPVTGNSQATLAQHGLSALVGAVAGGLVLLVVLAIGVGVAMYASGNGAGSVTSSQSPTAAPAPGPAPAPGAETATTAPANGTASPADATTSTADGTAATTDATTPSTDGTTSPADATTSPTATTAPAEPKATKPPKTTTKTTSAGAKKPAAATPDAGATTTATPPPADTPKKTEDEGWKVSSDIKNPFGN